MRLLGVVKSVAVLSSRLGVGVQLEGGLLKSLLLTCKLSLRLHCSVVQIWLHFWI